MSQEVHGSGGGFPWEGFFQYIIVPLIIFGSITDCRYDSIGCSKNAGRCEDMPRQCALQTEDCKASCLENNQNRPMASKDCLAECDSDARQCDSDIEECKKERQKAESEREEEEKESAQ